MSSLQVTTLTYLAQPLHKRTAKNNKSLKTLKKIYLPLQRKYQQLIQQQHQTETKQQLKSENHCLYRAILSVLNNIPPHCKINTLKVSNKNWALDAETYNDETIHQLLTAIKHSRNFKKILLTHIFNKKTIKFSFLLYHENKNH